MPGEYCGKRVLHDARSGYAVRNASAFSSAPLAPSATSAGGCAACAAEFVTTSPPLRAANGTKASAAAPSNCVPEQSLISARISPNDMARRVVLRGFTALSLNAFLMKP
jgi:hypothetical protein